jgi:hypothetical protein
MQPMLTGLGHWAWFIAAALLALAELFAPGFFFLWLGLAAAAVGAVLLVADLGWQNQFILFAVLAVISILGGRTYYRLRPMETDQPALNRRGQSYVGRVFALTEAIVNGTGKIRVEDTIWKVEGPDLPVGARVRVVSVDGAVLRVEAAP